MQYLPFTLIIVLSSSLFVALVINPMLTSVYMRVEEAEMNVRRLFITTGILIVLGLALLGAGFNTLGNLLVLGGVVGLINRYAFTPATACSRTACCRPSKTCTSACCGLPWPAPSRGSSSTA